MKKHKFWQGFWKIKCIDKNGNAIWEESGYNDLADEGEALMLDSFFRNLNNPSQFYCRLCNDTLEETDTLGSILNEPSGSGYIAKLIERSNVGFPVLELHEGDYRIISKEVVFSAVGGNIGPVNTAYLATTADNTGKLVAYKELSRERLILDGDSMVVQITIKLK